MFESAELGVVLTKERFKKSSEKLRVELLEAQRRLAGSQRSLIVLIGGVEGAGKSELANRLLSWLDARGVETHALWEPSDEERERPAFWRFWRRLPPKGRCALFLSSWYTEPIVGRAFNRLGRAQFDQKLDRIVDFERMLAQEGAIVVKLWLHITKKEQGRRLKALEREKDTRWRVTPLDWKFHKRYERFREVCEHALMKTSTAEAPWLVVDAFDKRHRDASAARLLLDAVDKGLAAEEKRAAPQPDRPKPKPRNILRALDLKLSLDKERFEKRLDGLQNELGRLARKLRDEERSLTLVFEGPDAAGKGGAIRRLMGGLDARLYKVSSVAAPSDEEKAHPYLWRFWRALPRTGRVSIYDRSWYGRVLVERVEGFAASQEWKRAFNEIAAFEQQLDEAGTIVLKFWIAISADEQLRRFKERQQTPFKQHKIGPEDWRNREKWEVYEAAACEMIERTSTERAPWVLVEGDDKRWARIKVLESVVARLERELR